MRRETKDVNLTARVTRETREKFFAKASSYGNPSEVLRELVTAFNDDRLSIQPPTTPTGKELMYVTRNQD